MPHVAGFHWLTAHIRLQIPPSQADIAAPIFIFSQLGSNKRLRQNSITPGVPYPPFPVFRSWSWTNTSPALVNILHNIYISKVNLCELSALVEYFFLISFFVGPWGRVGVQYSWRVNRKRFFLAWAHK